MDDYKEPWYFQVIVYITILLLTHCQVGYTKSGQDALVYDKDLLWENRGIYAPYVIKYKGLFYMFYADHNMEKAQCMNLATSKNLFEWEKHSSNPIFLPLAGQMSGIDKKAFIL